MEKVFSVKKDNFTDLICKGFCRYYKEGKEELTCGAYNFLAGNFTPRELESKIKRIKPDLSCDKMIKVLICDKCDFLRDGCDFRGGLDGPPCGGYTISEWLIKEIVDDS